MVLQQPEACRDVRRAAVHRGDQLAVRQACCPGPGLRSARVLSPVRASLSEQAWLSAQASRGEPQAQRLTEPWVLPWVQARAVPGEPLPEAAEEVSAHAAAEPQREAGAALVVLQAGPEAAHAAAGPQPEAARAASERQAAVGAAAEPDGPRAAAEEAGVRQGAAVRPQAAARLAGEAAQLPVAVRPDERALQAARRPAVPSAAASVFRQARSLGLAPARQRAARFAHAMRCLPIASRSEPSLQAARNEDWSWWSTSPEGSLTKCFDEQLRVRPDCGRRSGLGPIYFCTQITSLW
jgi:hypothetical protein